MQKRALVWHDQRRHPLRTRQIQSYLATAQSGYRLVVNVRLESLDDDEPPVTGLDVQYLLDRLGRTRHRPRPRIQSREGDGLPGLPTVCEPAIRPDGQPMRR